MNTKNTAPVATDVVAGWNRVRAMQAEVDAAKGALRTTEDAFLDTLPTDECPTWCTAASSDAPWIRGLHLWRSSEGGVTACREHVGQLNTWILS
ncbi:hypothetical protein HP550_02590 [Cellulomonas humilata]|uniref:Uncharacterized protein n=1 Tax=Cellulomonas humilata TaxID=144055 RepID=A0A7Y5ZXU3_9CELL|nr:hypothetical protein [Cellulomonas humilata]NUU16138.1 hypothetical protein [Cellulomonas humilata]